MVKFRSQSEAFGAPGIAPRWTHANKDGVGTAYSAEGETDTAMRSLIYLATSQEEDGGFAQNFWVNGEPDWGGIQLDEVSFPILLAWLLHRENVPFNFDFYPMIIRAAGFLVRHGPVTQEERWEETSGFSPATLACNIAALICAAQFARERGDEATGQFLEEYAEYIKLLRSSFDGKVFDYIPEVANRYLSDRSRCKSLEVWKFNRQVSQIKKGVTLRIQAVAPFRLHWSKDDWQTLEDTPSTSTALNIDCVDISVPAHQQIPIQFTFFWTASGDWEQCNYKVAVE